jgi:hypothetical protein
MNEISINFPLVDGSNLPLEFNSGKELIELVIGDDIRPPIRSMQIQIKTEEGRVIRIGVPYDNSKNFFVEIN